MGQTANETCTVPTSSSAREKLFKGVIAEVTTGRTRDGGDIKERENMELDGLYLKKYIYFY